jgi:hypothetical protein
MPEITPYTTNWTYQGEADMLGSLNLTLLAKSFEVITEGTLDYLFPDQDIPERQITVEQEIEGLAIMPVVRMGVPSGNFVEQPRYRSRSESPILVRQDDFLDQTVLNQIRKPGTYNEQWNPSEIIATRIQRMMGMHTRTKDFFRSQALLGGIYYTDPRTNQVVSVDTGIPDHNFFHYAGVDSALDALAAGAAVPGTPFEAGPAGYWANKVLKNRKEALLFTDAQGRAGIPWTDPQADIVRSVRLIKQFLWKTNKNKFTEMIMNSDLYMTIHENEFVKAFMGQMGVFGNYDMAGADGGKAVVTTGSSSANNPQFISYGPGGEIQAIAGVKIKVFDGQFRHPGTNTLEEYLPSNKIILVAPRHYADASATLGFTHHCVAESPNSTPGVWVRTTSAESQPTGYAPGRGIQMGDAFLPFAVHPHWISVVTVAEESYIADNLIINSMRNYGSF